jgi:release factor glutamine methyltransferase
MTTQEVWTTLKVLSWTKDFLGSKGIINSRLEAEWLLCEALNLDRVGLYLQYDKPLNDHELATYRALVTRRAKREPLQHVLGSQEFFGLEYFVSADVLVPRYDTEVLVSEALKRHPDARLILDIGTGSGCVAISLKKHLQRAVVSATDISEAALAVAKRNAVKHEAEIAFFHGSLFEPVSGCKFDLIVSNPPYIPTCDIETLEPEVRDYDPRVALDGGCDGLEIYRVLISESIRYLNPDGWLLVEIGKGQSGDVNNLFENVKAFTNIFMALDSGGIVRVVGAQIMEVP